DLLIKMIRGVADLYNWFVNLYNGSMMFRGVLSLIQYLFVQIFNTGKVVINTLIDGFSGLANVIKDILTLDFSNIGSSIENALKSVSGNFEIYGSDSGDAFADAFNKTLNGKMKTISLSSSSGGALDVALGTNYGGD